LFVLVRKMSWGCNKPAHSISILAYVFVPLDFKPHLLSLICVDLHTEIVLYELNLGKYSAQKEPEWYFSCRVSLILENITSIREMKWLCTRLHNKSSYALSRIHKS